MLRTDQVHVARWKRLHQTHQLVRQAIVAGESIGGTVVQTETTVQAEFIVKFRLAINNRNGFRRRTGIGAERAICYSKTAVQTSFCM